MNFPLHSDSEGVYLALDRCAKLQKHRFVACVLSFGTSSNLGRGYPVLRNNAVFFIGLIPLFSTHQTKLSQDPSVRLCHWIICPSSARVLVWASSVCRFKPVGCLSLFCNLSALNFRLEPLHKSTVCHCFTVLAETHHSTTYLSVIFFFSSTILECVLLLGSF